MPAKIDYVQKAVDAFALELEIMLQKQASWGRNQIMNLVREAKYRATVIAVRGESNE